MRCDRCGNDVEPLFDAATMTIYRCANCGEWARGVWDSAPVNPPLKNVRVRVVWRDARADAAQVANLRRVYPALSERSIAEVVAAAGEAPTMLLDVLPDWQAVDLQQKAAAVGLEIRLEDE